MHYGDFGGVVDVDDAVCSRSGCAGSEDVAVRGDRQVGIRGRDEGDGAASAGVKDASVDRSGADA